MMNIAWTLYSLIFFRNFFIYEFKNISCDLARLNCAYRVDCGFALQKYISDCTELISGNLNICPTACLKALIALTSTEKGQELMNCDCGDSKFCIQSKTRVEICRPAVLAATALNANVSCSIAKFICTSDYQCSTALRYYDIYCRNLFKGQRCTSRCNNSLSILNRQTMAMKLKNCYCDGSEDFPCQQIKDNTLNLCFSRGNGNEITNNNIDSDEDDEYVYLNKGTSDEYDDSVDDEDDDHFNDLDEKDDVFSNGVNSTANHFYLNLFMLISYLFSLSQILRK